MARRRKYGLNHAKYNLRDLVMLTEHHIEDAEEGMRDKDYSYAMKSILDIEGILEKQRPPIEFLERMWPLIAKTKLKILSRMAGLKD